MSDLSDLFDLSDMSDLSPLFGLSYLSYTHLSHIICDTLYDFPEINKLLMSHLIIITHKRRLLWVIYF
jgi:hypothetical protein